MNINYYRDTGLQADSPISLLSFKHSAYVKNSQISIISSVTDLQSESPAKQMIYS